MNTHYDHLSAISLSRRILHIEMSVTTWNLLSHLTTSEATNSLAVQ